MKKEDNFTSEMLDEVLAQKIGDLAQQESGSEEEVNVAHAIAELYTARAKDDEVKAKNKDLKRSRLWNGFLGVGKIVAIVGLGILGNALGYAFETENTHTSQTFREWRSKFKFDIM